jgi:dihydrofolate reductase
VNRVSKVVLYTLCSIDGAVQDPHRYFPDTLTPDGPPVFDQQLEDLETEMIATQTAVLLGRRTYQQWATYWPTSTVQPFADFINSVPKYVLTSTPLTHHWPPATAITGPLPQVLKDLKARTTGDIGVHGSITLAHGLLRAGLVDELCLAIGPVIDPLGPRLFESITDRCELELLSATPTSSGSLWLRYRTDNSMNEKLLADRNDGC